MNRPFTQMNNLIAALLLTSLTGVFAAPATAQSVNQLRKENESLQSDKQQLVDQLAAAQLRIDNLEAELVRLRDQLATRRRSIHDAEATAETQPRSGDQPFRSPRALLAHVVASYESAMNDLEMGRLVAGEPEADRLGYLKDVEQWAAGVNRDMRGHIEWPVTIVSAERARGGYQTILQAVDANTGHKIGDSFTVLVPESHARRLQKLELRDELNLLTLRGAALPRVKLNAQRDRRGTFDSPRYVGPFAEFRLSIDFKSLSPYEPPAAEDDSDSSSESKSTGATAQEN